MTSLNYLRALIGIVCTGQAVIMESFGGRHCWALTARQIVSYSNTVYKYLYAHFNERYKIFSVRQAVDGAGDRTASW